jgi:hypothetical protein
MDSHVTHSIEIPPALAAAIVAAQRAGDSLRRDSSGDKGKYTTADEIAFVARKALTEHGAAWVRLDVSLEARALAESDIGKQAYVGDVVERWAIVHEGGGVLLGSSRMPVITSMGRPHDKAVGASLTYDVGGALRGALCMDREDKNAIDRRADDDQREQVEREPEPAKPKQAPRPKPRPSTPAAGTPEAEQPRDALGPRCNGKAAGISKSIGERMRTMVEARGGKAADVWADVLMEAGIDVPKYGRVPRSEALTIPDGTAVRDYLIRVIDPPADMDALRSQAGKLWVRICQGPDGLKLDDWKAEWAAFAQIERWPDQPSAADLQHTIAGMTHALERMAS